MTDSQMPHMQDLEILSSFLRHEALTAKNFNDALACASLFGRLHWDNISGFFGDDAFEQALFEKWRGEFRDLPERNRPDTKPKTWAFVLSQVFSGGGHSRLLRQLSSGLADYDITQSLVVTRRAASDVLNALPDHLASKRVLRGSLTHRSVSLFGALRDEDVVLLLNNPDDIGAALAARALRERGVRVLFLNHADHVFSFGPGAADTVLEICATGWKTTAERRSAHAQHFMGIPLVSDGSTRSPIRSNTTGPILSIGGPIKYKPSSSLDFSAFLDRILKLVPNDVVLIGPSRKESWWADVSRKHPDRLHLMGVQPPETVRSEFGRASCYVDSFPMDGGTVFSEAIMNGLPSFGLNRNAALGISPADALRCDGVDQLVSNVTEYLSSGAYSAELASVQNQIRHEFSNAAVAARVLHAANGVAEPLPDYLAALGNRSPDYNAENWREDARLHCPKRIWRKLSLGARARIFRKVGDLGLSRAVAREIRHRIWIG